MTLPALLFGFMVATLMGAALHLWRGGNLGRLILDVILAWIGFWIGHFIGDALGWQFASVGALHLGTGIRIGAVFLALGYWLSLVKDGSRP